MDLTAFLFVFLVGVFFYWVGSQYSNKFFAFMAALVFLSSGFFVVAEGISYPVVTNYSTSFTPDYSAFYNDTATCINCSSSASLTCSGVLDCSQHLTQDACVACDQCQWDSVCLPLVQDANCTASLTCVECGCNATSSACGAFIGEHDVNETRSGSIVQAVNYTYETVNADLTRVIGWIFALSGLFTLLMLALQWRNGEL
jgi:hypothetical protein